ncbi:MAG: ECF-type sigma factor [Phycisphaerales bacterium]
MTNKEPQDVTVLVEAATRGDRLAAEQLLPVVYEELRRLAESQLGREPAGHTLQPTALVHEAYLRLLGGQAGDEVKWDGRGHFFASAARAMRHILVERARRYAAAKRGGDRRREALDSRVGTIAVDSKGAEPVDLVALDRALDELQRRDEMQHDVVMLRYFAGLSIEQAAAALGVSAATVKNKWSFARAWLRRSLHEDDAGARA